MIDNSHSNIGAVDGWIEVTSEDGYVWWIQDFKIRSKTLAVVIDNFSYSPFGILKFSHKHLIIDKQWLSLYEDRFIDFSSVHAGISYLLDQVSHEDAFIIDSFYRKYIE